MNLAEFFSGLAKLVKIPEWVKELTTFNSYWDSVEDKASLLIELLELSPQCEVLFEQFDREKLKAKDQQHVFTALGNVLLILASEISKEDGSKVGDKADLIDCAQQMMQTLLLKYSAAIARTLKLGNTAPCLVPTIRCLTAGVLASEQSAAVVVSSLDWTVLGNVITRREKDPLLDPRTWCFYLYTALFEMHTNEAIFVPFLRSGALSLLYEGLQEDSPELIVDIFNKLREKVLFNPLVGKSLKVQLFNGNTMTHVVALHRWPQHSVNELNQTIMVKNVPEDPEELEHAKKIINEALAKFLRLVCASYKFGIAFAASDDHVPNNGHALNIIKKMTVFAYVDPLYRDVVSSVLVACPDILPAFALSIKSSFDVAPNKYFKAVMELYMDIVGKVNVSYVIEREHEFILKLLLPVPLSGSYIHSIISHHSNDFGLKVCGLRLLEKIISAAEKVIKGLLENLYFKKANAVEKTVQGFLQKAVPSVEELVSVWHTVNQSDEATEGDGKNQLLVVQALSLYARFLPSPDLNSIVKPDHLLAATIQMTHLRDDDKLQLLIACLQLINTLQSKFDVLTQARDEKMQQDLLDTFKLLLSLYLDGMKADDEEENGSKQKNILQPLADHIEQTLIKYGFSSHSEANIRFWLEALVGRDEACVDFLCQSLVTTIASLEQFSDQVVVITRNTAVEQVLDPSLLAETITSSADEESVEDSVDIVSANVPLSFSRLILGNLELLAKDKSASVMDYFFHVIEQYIRHLPDPQVLAQYLLTDTDLKIPNSLARCCRYWLGQKPVGDKTVNKGETVAEYMEYMFMTKDYHFVDEVIKEKSSLTLPFEDRQNLIKSTLLFLQVDTSDTADVVKEDAIEAYVKVLWHLTLDDCTSAEEGSITDLCILALNHHALMRGNPFKPGKLSSFVATLLQRVSNDVESSRAIPTKYFKQYCQKLAMMLNKGSIDMNLDYWAPFEPLLGRASFSPDNVYPLVETLFTFSELFTQSASILKLAMTALETLKSSPLGNDANDVKFHRLLHSKLEKYASVLTSKAEPNEELLTVFKCVWDLLACALQPSEAGALDHGKLKGLLTMSQHLGGSLLLRALQLYPPHTAYITKRITRTGPVLPGHASVLLFLLESPDADQEFVLQMLEAAKPTIVAWLKEYDAADQPGYQGLAALMVARNLIGGGEAGSVVKGVYSRMVEEGDAPPEHLTTLCLVCEGLKGHKKESRLPCPDALVSSLHLLLCYIEKKFSRHVTAQQSLQVEAAVQRVHDLLPKLYRRTRPDRARPDLWLKFAKKVIKTSLREGSELCAQVLSCLGALCEWQYSVTEGGAAPVISSDTSTAKPLTVRDLHSLLVSHARYDNLMLKAATDAQFKVKEAVLELQCTLLRLSPAAARDLHASKILAAYNATTQPHDQAALKLLKQYEEVGGLEQLLPVMWGDAAVTYYGVGSVMPVFREPRPEQVMGLYHAKTIMNTCINYDRTMSSKASVRCSVPSPSVGPVYDLRFLLPSLVFVARKHYAFKTVPQEAVLPQMVAVAMAALAAQDIAIRSQAVKLIRILRLVLERIRVDRVRLFWVWLLDIVCYTLATTAATARQAMEKINKSKKPPAAADDAPTVPAAGDDSLYPLAAVAPLSGPITRFLVETVMTTEHPEHPLYSMLMNYMFLFPYMKTNKIPELQRLYHNSSPQHSVQAQLLLLRLLSQGVRTSADFALVQRVHVVPLILALLHSPTATHQIQLEAVEALSAMVAISAGCNRLLRHHELLQLLPSLLQRGSMRDTASARAQRGLVRAVVQLLSVAWTQLERGGEDQDTSASEQTAVEGDGGRAEEAEEHMDEGEDGYEGYDEGYYDEGYDDYDEDYFSDEEKSKVRKKRKLEAKNRKAAKKAKLEENVILSKQTRNKDVVVKVDTILICDFIQCLLSITSKVYETKDVEAVKKLQTLTSSIDSYIKTKVSAKKVNVLISTAVETLIKHVATCKASYNSARLTT